MEPWITAATNTGPLLDRLSDQFVTFIDANKPDAWSRTTGSLLAQLPEIPDDLRPLYRFVACKAAYAAVLLALETEYPRFRDSDAHRGLRLTVGPKLTQALREFAGDFIPAEAIEAKSIELAAQEAVDCEHAARQTLDNLSADTQFPVDPVYRLIEAALPLAPDGEAVDRDGAYNAVFVDMVTTARKALIA